MSGFREHWKAVIFFGALLWLVLYIVAWISRSDCEAINTFACAINAFGTAGTDLILFNWVWSHGELAAGLLAVLAAVIVVVHGMSESDRRANADNLLKFERLLGRIAATAFMAKAAGINLLVGDAPSTLSAIAQIESQLTIVSEEVPQITVEGLYCLTWARRSIRRMKPGNDAALQKRHRDEAIMWLSALGHWLAEPTGMFEPNRAFKFRRAKVSQTRSKYVRDLPLSASQGKRLDELLEFDAEGS